MIVWTAFKTHDSCNGCPWMFIGVGTTQEIAKSLAEEHARPWIPFGQPKIGIGRRPKVLTWGHDPDQLITEDLDPDTLVAAHEGEHYIVTQELLHDEARDR